MTNNAIYYAKYLVLFYIISFVLVIAVSKDKNNEEEIDSLRQQIEELRDIITKKKS